MVGFKGEMKRETHKKRGIKGIIIKGNHFGNPLTSETPMCPDFDRTQASKPGQQTNKRTDQHQQTKQASDMQRAALLARCFDLWQDISDRFEGPHLKLASALVVPHCLLARHALKESGYLESGAPCLDSTKKGQGC